MEPLFPYGVRWNWAEAISHLLRLLLAYALALPIGLDRERSTAQLGLRTIPLVALASCGYLLIAVSVLGVRSDDQSRIIQGLLGGLGFIGGGAILKEGGTVRGTATAASIWTTGAVGAAVAYGRFEIAVVLAVINYATLHWLTPLEERLGLSEEEKAGPG